MQSMMVVKVISFLCLFYAMTQDVTAQKQQTTLANVFERMMKQVRQNESVTFNTKDFLSEDPLVVLSLLIRYENDSSSTVRHFAYTLSWQVAMFHPNSEVLQLVTAQLIKALSDPEPLVWQHAGKHLLSFHAIDFTEESKETIHRFFADKDFRREIVLVAGVANMQQELRILETLLIDEPAYELTPHAGRWYGTVGWAARLARARMGIMEDITRCIELVQHEPDPIIRVTILLGDLGYIRQPAAIKAIWAYLKSDENLPRVKESIPGMPHSQHATDVLAECLSNFSVQKKYVGGYSQAEIDLCRKWMSAQKEWRIIR